MNTCIHTNQFHADPVIYCPDCGAAHFPDKGNELGRWHFPKYCKIKQNKFQVAWGCYNRFGDIFRTTVASTKSQSIRAFLEEVPADKVWKHWEERGFKVGRIHLRVAKPFRYGSKQK